MLLWSFELHIFHFQTRIDYHYTAWPLQMYRMLACFLEMMSYGKQAVELLEAKVKSSLKDDEVRVFVLSDDVSEVEKVKCLIL